MKRIIAVAILCGLTSWAFAQGQFQFNNYVSGVVRAPVYLPDPANPTVRLVGNDASGIPAGTTVYTGGKVAGTGYTAEMWWGTSAESLQPVDGARMTFRTGNAAGFLDQTSGPTAPSIPGTSPNQTVWLQLRVWDNKGGTITSWADALAYWNSAVDPNYAIGYSDPFQYSLGGGITTPPALEGLRSFSLYTNVPEPATLALLGIGGLGLLIRRRK